MRNPVRKRAGPNSFFPAPGKGEGRVVEPALIRDAFSECDNDVAWLLTDAGKHARDDASTDEGRKVPEDQELGVESRLERQIGWQLRRLCQWDEPFGEPDRAVLYELLRLHHILLADGDTGLPADSVERLVDDAKRFGDSIRKFGDTSLPRVSDAIFVNGAMESKEHLEQCTKIADALLVMFAQSSREPDRNLRKLPEWLQEAGVRTVFWTKLIMTGAQVQVLTSSTRSYVECCCFGRRGHASCVTPCMICSDTGFLPLAKSGRRMVLHRVRRVVQVRDATVGSRSSDIVAPARRRS